MTLLTKLKNIYNYEYHIHTINNSPRRLDYRNNSRNYQYLENSQTHNEVKDEKDY